MIAVISPAKTLDFDSECPNSHTLPRFPEQTQHLIDVLRTKTVDDIRSLMSVSEKIATLNVDRYHAFSSDYTEENAKPCGYAFKGDVYVGLEAENFTPEDMDFAQSHLRILSGLYGVLRPMDRIQAYRLEMGTKLAFDDYHTLYQFWEDKIADMLNQDLEAQGDDVLVNLASQEYFKAISKSRLKARVIDVEFLDLKNDRFKVISFYAKKARGMMSKFIIDHRLNQVEELKAFNYGGYYFSDHESDDSRLVFKRD